MIQVLVWVRVMVCNSISSTPVSLISRYTVTYHNSNPHQHLYHWYQDILLHTITLTHTNICIIDIKNILISMIHVLVWVRVMVCNSISWYQWYMCWCGLELWYVTVYLDIHLYHWYQDILLHTITLTHTNTCIIDIKIHCYIP
jgi:hypothetical protein